VVKQLPGFIKPNFQNLSNRYIYHMLAAKTNVRCYRFEGGTCQPIETQAITETSVTLTVNGDDWLALMCTPLDIDALAVGFLFNEGLIHSKNEIASVRVCPTGDNVDVWLTHVVEKPAQWRRTSGCTGGVTGVPAVEKHASGGGLPAKDGVTLSPEQITALVTQLFAAQDLYQTAGGVHTSALSDGKRILIATEDIGRHNTLDKIAGRCLLDGINPLQRVLVTTGRVSSEMMQKAARIGASVVISRTAPSSLSIEIAEQSGITLIGYARRDRFTVYCHAERVVTGPAEAPACPETENIAETQA
jgi:FdhD protein